MPSTDGDCVVWPCVSVLQSVQTLSLWVIHHHKHANMIVEGWARVLSEGLLHGCCTVLLVGCMGGVLLLWSMPSGCQCAARQVHPHPLTH